MEKFEVLVSSMLDRKTNKLVMHGDEIELSDDKAIALHLERGNIKRKTSATKASAVVKKE